MTFALVSDIMEPPIMMSAVNRADQNYHLLHQSIGNRGILVPLIVTRRGDKWRCISGTKRLAIARELRIKEVPIFEIACDDHEIPLIQWDCNLDMPHTEPQRRQYLLRIIDQNKGMNLPFLLSMVTVHGYNAVHLLGLNNLVPSLRERVEKGTINLERALTLAWVPYGSKQIEVYMEHHDNTTIEEFRIICSKHRRY